MTISGRAACAHCGTEINPANGRIYCSNACSQAAWRERNSVESRVWDGTEIQRRRSDGYVNATAMCKANYREWFTYARSDRTKEYIEALKAAPQFCGSEPVQSIRGGQPHLQGTWVHPRLAVDLARWISPAFAVWMDGWFLEAAAAQAAPRQRRRARRLTPAPATIPAPVGSSAAEELFSLLSAVCPYLQEKEWQSQMLGEPEEGPVYQNLLAAVGSAQVAVRRVLRHVRST